VSAGTPAVDQSCIDPGAAAGGEGGRAGVVVGAGVAGAARGGAGTPEAAPGSESLLTRGVSTGASLWTGLNRVTGGLVGGGSKYIGGGGGTPHQPTAHPAHAKQPPQPP
jgi:hypothetical protein